MKKSLVNYIVPLLMAVGGALYLIQLRQPDDRIIHYSDRIVSYSFSVRNLSGETVTDTPIKIFAPLPLTSWQRTRGIESAFPSSVEITPNGNQFIKFLITLPPFANKYVTLQAEVTLADTPSVDGDSPARYIEPGPRVESDDPTLVEVAHRLRREDTTSTAHALYEWVSNNLKEGPYDRETRGALWALRERHGDCTEFAYLFIALARSNRIPARPIGGYVLDGRSVLKASGYHNWAEFYDGERWRLVDPMKRVFDTRYQDYLAFQIVGDEATSRRFFTDDTRVEVRLD